MIAINRKLALVISLAIFMVSCRFFEQGTPGNVSRKDELSNFGQQKQGAENSSDTTNEDGVIIVKEYADLPVCAETTVNQVYYLESTEEFFVCSFDGTTYGYQSMDVSPNDLLLQNCDAEDLLQEATEIIVADPICTEGLGGTQITLGCDLNGNGVLDVGATPNEISGTQRNICNTSAPPQTTADMSLALAPTGSDNANCQTATPCLTFATAISKVPKTINHTVTIVIQGNMTLTETVNIQGFTVGSAGTLDIRSSTDGSDWTVDAESTRDYAINVEGVSGTGTFILHDLVVQNANTAGIRIDSSRVNLGALAANSNSGDGIYVDNSSEVSTLTGGPHDVITNSNGGVGIQVEDGSTVSVTNLTVTNNTGKGIVIATDGDLTASSLSAVTGNGDTAVDVNNSKISLTGASDINVSLATGGSLVTDAVGANGAINATNDSEIFLKYLRIQSTASHGIRVNQSRGTIEDTVSNDNTGHGLTAASNSYLTVSSSAFSENDLTGVRASDSTIRLNSFGGGGSTLFIIDNDGVGIELAGASSVILEPPYNVQDNDDGTGDTQIEISSFSTFLRYTINPGTIVCEDISGATASTGCEGTYCMGDDRTTPGGSSCPP